MPTFGEFETVGQPLVSSDERGELTTIWRARKTGAPQERLYAVKCVAPRPAESREGASKDELDQDARLKFIKEAVEPLKRAQTKGGRCLAPIYQFGTNETEAWYVTDFYGLSNTLSNSLKQYINGKGEATSAVLRHILESVVAACLALRQWRGYSHGNLKPSNIFRASRAEWRKAPVFVSDPYPAPPVQFDRYEAGDLSDVSETLRATLEAQDLAAIGALILQLVERRLFVRNDDYNYPVERSRDWEALGKDADYWLGWCNKLLDPQLSLGNINLERLAQEFQPSAVAKKMPLVLAGAGAVCVVAVLGYSLVAWLGSRGEKAFQRDFRAGTNEFGLGHLVEAREKIDAALRRKPQNAEAGAWKTKIRDQLNEKSATALKQATQSLGLAQEALGAKNYVKGQAELLNASNCWAAAKSLRVDETEVNRFKSALDEQYKIVAGTFAQYSAALANISTGLDRSRTAITAQDFPKAQEQLLNASNSWLTAKALGVNDSEVAGLKPGLDEQFRVLAAAINDRTARQAQYGTTVSNLNAALTRATVATNDYVKMQSELAGASNLWFSAKGLAGNEPELVRFKARLDEQFTALAGILTERNTRIFRYGTAVTNVNLGLARVKAAVGTNDYSRAQTELVNASNEWFVAKGTGVNDPETTGLKTALDEQYRALGTALAELSAKLGQYGTAVTNLNVALGRAQVAFGANDYSRARQELANASNSWFTASALEINKTEITALKATLDEQYRNVGTAMADQHSRQVQYDTAVTNLNTALVRAKAASSTNDYAAAQRELNAASNHWFTARSTRVSETEVTRLKTALDEQYKTLATAWSELTTRQGDYAKAVTNLNAALGRAKLAFGTNNFTTAQQELGKASNNWFTAKSTGLNEPEVTQLKNTLDQQYSALSAMVADRDKRMGEYSRAVTNVLAALDQARAAAATNGYALAQTELETASNYWATAQKTGLNPSELATLKASLDREYAKMGGALTERTVKYGEAVTNVTAALARAQTAASTNNYPEAEGELRVASNYWAIAKALGINETQTAELKGAWDQQWRTVTRDHSNAVVCVSALKSATNALDQAQKALTSSNTIAARASLVNGNSNLLLAIALGAKASTTQELQRTLASLSQSADYQDAQALFATNDYRGALVICDKHTDIGRFVSLASAIRDEQSTFEKANDQFRKGEYSFLEDLQSKSCTNKTVFADLIRQAVAERSRLLELQPLTKSAADWAKLDAAITGGRVPDKPPFQAIKLWWNENNPKLNLEMELRTFQLLFGIRNPTGYQFPSGEPQRFLEKLKRQNVLPANYVVSQTAKLNELPRIADVNRCQDYVQSLQKRWSGQEQLSSEVKKQFDALNGRMLRFGPSF